MQYQITVPDGNHPGDQLEVETAGGLVFVTVPRNLGPDRVLKFLGPRGGATPTKDSVFIGAILEVVSPLAVNGQSLTSGTKGTVVQADGGDWRVRFDGITPEVSIHTNRGDHSHLAFSKDAPVVNGLASDPGELPTSKYDPNERLPKRKNALQKPWSLRFRAGLGLFLLILGLHSVVAWKASHLAASCVFLLAWLAMFAAALALVVSDPRDEGGAEASVRCFQCQLQVRAESKHCWECQECVVGFDHHCPWLNMCVGRRNYGKYLTLIVLVFLVNFLHVVVGSLVAFELFFEGDDVAFTVLVFVIAALFLPFVFLDGFLILFHIQLFRRDITTYEYWLGHKPAARGAVLVKEEESVPVRAISRASHSSSLSSRSRSTFKDLVEAGYHNFVAAPLPAEPSQSRPLDRV